MFLKEIQAELTKHEMEIKSFSEPDEFEILKSGYYQILIATLSQSNQYLQNEDLSWLTSEIISNTPRNTREGKTSLITAIRNTTFHAHHENKMKRLADILEGQVNNNHQLTGIPPLVF